ncbi:ATPase H+ transporting accessory protein 1 like a isoform X2 [Scleropages formosus]|uniref:ATPase H+ transporting accessory protein 1 like a isoform X2 n=1 Tax=Scleropages formosus TaxID=113540 RepID=UPI0010FA8DAC|nr:V-type proton ATPase subunit S1-like isoform X2 [Scleropages formosus]
MAKHKLLLFCMTSLLPFLQPSLSFDQVPAVVEESSDDPSYQAIRDRNDAAPVGRSSISQGGKCLPEAENPFRRKLQSLPLLRKLREEADPGATAQVRSPPKSKRRLLQSSSPLPYSPLNVVHNGKTCILFRAKKLAIRYKNQTFVDLTERAFGPDAPVDTRGSICSKDKATLQMSNTFYESAGQNWFTLDSVHIHYNWTQEATFNATEVYAPATYSYHCEHVSSLQKYDTLLVPSSNADSAANWHITFTDFQIQAFNVQSNKFASASDCATFFTPAILMGLITSLILLLVLAYALHMVVHLKHIDRYEEHKATVYFPRSPEAECPDKNSL